MSHGDTVELSGEQFRQIVAHLKTLPSSSDKRKSPRVGLRTQVLMSELSDKGHKPSPPEYVRVRDLSPTGIGLMHNHRIPPGSQFVIRLPVATAHDLLAVYEVKHCKAVDMGMFGIGALLIKLHDPDGKAMAEHSDHGKPAAKAHAADHDLEGAQFADPAKAEAADKNQSQAAAATAGKAE
jgi:hypothetical protein